MCEQVRYHDAKSTISFSTILTNCFAQSALNFKVVFIIDRTTLWQEFMMHHAIAIEENSEQNLHIWPNLICFFRSWLFWTLPLQWFDFGFNVVAIHLWFVTNYDLFEQIWIVIERHELLLSDVHVTLFFLKLVILQFWNNLRCSKTCLPWAERYANIISNLSNRYSTIVQNYFQLLTCSGDQDQHCHWRFLGLP